MAAGTREGAAQAVTVAVVSSKGGVGKTALATGLAAACVRTGRQVVLVDADPQGNATTALGIAASRTLAHVLMEDVPLTAALVEARPGLLLLPGDWTVAQLDGWLYADPNGRHLALREVLATLPAHDLVLLDTAPGISMVNAMCYLAADALVVPCSADGLALRGVRGVEEARARLATGGVTPPPVLLAVPTFADRRHGRTPLVEEALRLKYGECTGPALRVCSALAVAHANGRTIYEHAPQATAAADLDALAARLLAVLSATAPTGATAATEATA